MIDRVSGYYEVNTGMLRETMKVITPQIDDRSTLGVYIQRECTDYPIYQLEKYVSGGKRMGIITCKTVLTSQLLAVGGENSPQTSDITAI